MQNFDDLISSIEKSIQDNNDVLQSDILDTQIINLSNQLLIEAIERNAYAIHIEPLEDILRIRFRINDILYEPFKLLSKEIISPIIRQFKIMANLCHEESQIPEISIIQQIYQGHTVRFLVDTIPSLYGEKIVLRRYDKNPINLDLNKLIVNCETLQLIRKIIRHPFGLILVAGYEGCGMTTTLYSLLAELNKPDKNIICFTDKGIEYSLPGINQFSGREINMRINCCMRQDPDVILVDEVRSWETAKSVINAAEKCLVLAGLHTSSAPEAILRLEEMGLEQFRILDLVKGVISQRLLRRVCSNCAIIYTPTKAELAHFGLIAPIADFN
jgi:type IV pilus assembly protein PilB